MNNFDIYVPDVESVKIHTPDIPYSYTIPKKQLEAETKLVFSFKFWGQIRFFGLDTVDTKWFVSLLERLKALEHYDSKIMKTNARLKDVLHYHPVKWDQKNIPIKKVDLTWVPQYILNNDIEFPFYQIGISQSCGRIIGYFFSENRFDVVLLDPEHNIYPTRLTEYRVDDCLPLRSDYESLIFDIDSVRTLGCKNEACGLQKGIKNMPTKCNQVNVVKIYLDDALLKEAESIMKDNNKDYKDILEAGLLSYLEKD